MSRIVLTKMDLISGTNNPRQLLKAWLSTGSRCASLCVGKQAYAAIPFAMQQTHRNIHKFLKSKFILVCLGRKRS